MSCRIHGPTCSGDHAADVHPVRTIRHMPQPSNVVRRVLTPAQQELIANIVRDSEIHLRSRRQTPCDRSGEVRHWLDVRRDRSVLPDGRLWLSAGAVRRDREAVNAFVWFYLYRLHMRRRHSDGRANCPTCYDIVIAPHRWMGRDRTHP